MTQAYLDCHKEVVLNFIAAIAITLAILAAAGATAATGGAGSPATIPFMAMLAAMIPAAANAGKGVSNDDENCVNDSCPKANEKFHLKIIGLQNRGMIHAYKTFWEAEPWGHYDICACRKGAIVIAEVYQCGRTSNYQSITRERWKDPVIPWDGI